MRGVQWKEGINNKQVQHGWEAGGAENPARRISVVSRSTEPKEM